MAANQEDLRVKMKFGQYWRGADTRQRRDYQVYSGDENWPENVNASLILLYYPMPFPVPHFSRRVIHYPPLPTIQTQSRSQQTSLPRVFPVIIRRRTPPGGLSSTLSSLSKQTSPNLTVGHLKFERRKENRRRAAAPFVTTWIALKLGGARAVGRIPNSDRCSSIERRHSVRHRCCVRSSSHSGLQSTNGQID